MSNDAHIGSGLMNIGDDTVGTPPQLEFGQDVEHSVGPLDGQERNPRWAQRAPGDALAEGQHRQPRRDLRHDGEDGIEYGCSDMAGGDGGTVKAGARRDGLPAIWNGPGSDVSLVRRVLCVNPSGEPGGRGRKRKGTTGDVPNSPAGQRDDRPGNHKFKRSGTVHEEIVVAADGDRGHCEPATSSENGGPGAGGGPTVAGVVDIDAVLGADGKRHRGYGALDPPGNAGLQPGKRRRLRGKQSTRGGLAVNSVHAELSGGPSRSSTSSPHRCSAHDRDGQPLIAGCGRPPDPGRRHVAGG